MVTETKTMLDDGDNGDDGDKLIMEVAMTRTALLWTR